MINMKNFFHFIPCRYRFCASVVCFIYLLIFLIYLRPSPELQEETTTTASTNIFDLYDDNDMYLLCPPDSVFNITHRRHLAIIVGPNLTSFAWKNFRALLCIGVDAYVMLNEVFYINSSSRGDGYRAQTNRSIRSYTHRFLHIPDRELEKYGVSYMSKFPKLKYSSWERAIVWLYHRRDLTNAWIIDYGVHWFHAGNMTYLFDLYAPDTTDVLCADVIASDASFWVNWPKTQTDILPKHYWTGTYSPLVRWSRRLLFHHYKYMQLMHTNRLKYDLNEDYRFKDFLMGTVASIERLSVGLYNKKHHFTQLGLDNFNDTSILSLLQDGKHIIYPVKHDSILTKYRLKQIAKMMNDNNLIFSEEVPKKHKRKVKHNRNLKFNQTHT
jgi:hypothetical protein